MADSFGSRSAFLAGLAGVRPPSPLDTSRKASGWTCRRSEPLVQFQMLSTHIPEGISLELQHDSQQGIPPETYDVVIFVALKILTDQ